jgi:hypothetical protein
MYKLPYTGCAFTIWPFNIGSPAIGPFYEYRLVYNAAQNRWDYYINGIVKAAAITGWAIASADTMDVGSELAPAHISTVEMGPTNFQQLEYRLTNGTWVPFYYHDLIVCMPNPPMNPYNLIYPVSAPDWIYVWGPAVGGYCGAGAP